jgi:hypothetical protein
MADHDARMTCPELAERLWIGTPAECVEQDACALARDRQIKFLDCPGAPIGDGQIEWRAAAERSTKMRENRLATAQEHAASSERVGEEI